MCHDIGGAISGKGRERRTTTGVWARLSRAWIDLPLAHKAAASVLLPLQALLIGCVSLYFVSAAERDARQSLVRSMQVRSYLQAISTELLTVDTVLHDVLITGARSSLSLPEDAHHTITGYLRDLHLLVAAGPAQAESVGELRPLLDAKFDSIQRFSTKANEPLRGAGHTAELTQLLTETRQITIALGSRLDQIARGQSEFQQQRTSELELFRALHLAVNTGTLVLGALGAIGGIWLLRRSIVARVRRIAENAERLTRELPLTPAPSGQDEIGELARRLEYTSGLLTTRTAAFRAEAARVQAKIAEGAKVEKAHRESEARLQAILDHTSAVVYVKDLQSRFQMVNRQFEALFQISRHDIRGRSSTDLFGTTLGQPLIAHDAEVIRQGIPLEFEEVVPQDDGEHTFLSTKFPLLDHAGQPYAICGISTDITLRKAAEQRLRASNEELEARVQERTKELEQANASLRAEIGQHLATTERLQASQEQYLHAQKMEALGLLAGGVAHDFNNILTAIMGYGTVLLEELPQDQREQSHVAEILRAARRAAALSNQLLAFSRRQPYQPKILNLSVQVRQLEQMLRHVIGDRVMLRTDLADDLPNVKADAGQIEQVLLNLVVNARDAMPGDGTIVVSTRAVTLPESEVKIEGAAREFVALSVHDTGSGISAAVMANMYEPFFTTKLPGRGTGLGLASCQAIAQQSGAWLACETKVGEGTTFTIYLQQVSGSAEAMAGGGASVELARGSETILVVEDEPAVGQVVALLLSNLGYEVVMAEDGEEAERKIAERGERGIDLVLTDLNMPRMNGRELMERLAVANPALKILLTSGNDELLDAERAAELEVDFLPKPFTLQTLARKVRTILDHSRSTENSIVSKHEQSPGIHCG